MMTIATDAEGQESGQEVSDFTPLTAAQAQALREQHPSISPWWVVVGQLVVGVLVTLVAWLVTGSQTIAWSAASGALAVMVPAALFARGVTGQFASVNAGSAVLSFFVWEMVARPRPTSGVGAVLRRCGDLALGGLGTKPSSPI